MTRMIMVRVREGAGDGATHTLGRRREGRHIPAQVTRRQDVQPLAHLCAGGRLWLLQDPG